MQALIIDERKDWLDRGLLALIETGMQVIGTGSVMVAETCLRRMPVDLLIADRDALGDALGDLLGMAETRNAYLVTVLQTQQVSADVSELQPHFTSLHCVLGRDLGPELAVKLGLASLANHKPTGLTLPAEAVGEGTAVTSPYQLDKPTRRRFELHPDPDYVDLPAGSVAAEFVV